MFSCVRIAAGKESASSSLSVTVRRPRGRSAPRSRNRLALPVATVTTTRESHAAYIARPSASLSFSLSLSLCLRQLLSLSKIHAREIYDASRSIVSKLFRALRIKRREVRVEKSIKSTVRRSAEVVGQKRKIHRSQVSSLTRKFFLPQADMIENQSGDKERLMRAWRTCDPGKFSWRHLNTTLTYRRARCLLEQAANDK